MIIGLDISTSTIGICILDNFKSIIYMNYIDLTKIKNLNEKANKFKDEMKQLIDKYNVTDIIIENYLSGFKMGRTSQKTIILLSMFNGIAQYILNTEFKNINVKGMNVRSARKKVIGVIPKGINGKQFVYDYFLNNVKWEFAKNRNEKYIKQSYDMVDAWIMAKSF
jgi:RNase H-fold protein (predicted Holliday junction resolvase)